MVHPATRNAETGRCLCSNRTYRTKLICTLPISTRRVRTVNRMEKETKRKTPTRPNREQWDDWGLRSNIWVLNRWQKTAHVLRNLSYCTVFFYCSLAIVLPLLARASRLCANLSHLHRTWQLLAISSLWHNDHKLFGLSELL